MDVCILVLFIYLDFFFLFSYGVNCSVLDFDLIDIFFLFLLFFILLFLAAIAQRWPLGFGEETRAAQTTTTIYLNIYLNK